MHYSKHILCGFELFLKRLRVAMFTGESWVNHQYRVAQPIRFKHYAKNNKYTKLIESYVWVQIKAFLPFFVSMKFPSLVRNGEQFALRATVYNFLDSVQMVGFALQQNH